MGRAPRALLLKSFQLNFGVRWLLNYMGVGE
jgi:hypothetical protein